MSTQIYSSELIEQKFGFTNEWMQKYIELIQTCKIPDCERGEKHHVFPTCVFGKNDLTVKLSSLNHFKAHWLLYKAYHDYPERNLQDYTKICFSLSSFNQVNASRKEKLSTLNESEIEMYGELIAEAREANRNAMIGDNNPAKRPEVRKLISETNTGRIWTGDREKASLRMLEFYDTDEGEAFKNKMSELKSGIPLKPEHYEKVLANNQSPEARERARRNSLERNANPEWREATYTQEYRNVVSLRFKGLPKPEGFGQKISEALTGVPKPWNAITNRNPEKIRKTAEKHTGMKRTENAKKNMSDAAKRRFEGGTAPHNKGMKMFYNPQNLDERIQCYPEDCPAGWLHGNPRKPKSKDIENLL